MSSEELISRAKLAALTWWMVISYIVLFVFNAIATAAIAALTGADWSMLSTTKKCLIALAIVANSSNTLMAFLNQAMNKIKTINENDKSDETKTP